MAAAALLCAACSDDRPPVGQIGHVEGHFGGVVSDEPRAALIGRNVLSAGGNAVDAVVATYFALSVTYPGAASLGGEGACVVLPSGHAWPPEAIEFPLRLVRRDGRTIAVPGIVRGMFALHARHGRLAWARLVQPGERLARFGNQVSRAFARQLAEAPDAAFRWSGMGEAFVKNGKRVGEGDTIRQVQLATVLASIRARGAGDFYTGDVAKRMAAGLAENADVPVEVADLREYRPRWSGTAHVEVGDHELHLPAGPKADAALALWRRLDDGGAADTRAPDARAPGAGGDSTGFAAMDIESGVAACTVGAHGALRQGRVIGDTGILAAGPRPPGQQYPGLAAILVNAPRKDALGAATASGPPGSEAHTVGVASRVFRDNMAPVEAFGAAAPADPRARANFLFCPEGIATEAETCRYFVQPGAHGLAVDAGL